MNINRHNYEEYFILYMDKELGIDDRREVEEFIQRHPDLKEELEMLLLSKFSPDNDIVFEKKEELVMQADLSSINLSNYEEWLVMYIDDELDAKQRKDVEQFAALHSQIYEELVLLQQTKLLSEQEIIFPDKDLLYHRIEKVRVIYFNWRKIAVAAVLLIAVGVTALLVYNKKPTGQSGEVVSAPNKEQKTVTPVAASNESNQKVDQPVIANNVQQALVQTAKQIPAGSAVKNVANKKLSDNLPLQEKKEELVAKNNQKPSNNLPKPLNPIRETNDAVNDVATINTNPIPNIQNSLTNNLVTTNTTQPSQVVYNPSANNDDLNQSGGKKSKLRGLLRKVTRTFEKNTNINATDDDRLLVGGLAFKLK